MIIQMTGIWMQKRLNTHQNNKCSPQQMHYCSLDKNYSFRKLLRLLAISKHGMSAVPSFQIGHEMWNRPMMFHIFNRRTRSCRFGAASSPPPSTTFTPPTSSGCSARAVTSTRPSSSPTPPTSCASGCSSASAGVSTQTAKALRR